MIVLGGFNEDEVYARTEREVDALIDRVMSDLLQKGVTSDGFEIVPERAVISIVKGRYPEETDERWPSNYLYVSVNTKSGYGALKWWTSEVPEGAPDGDVTRFVWTSGNPDPPSFDPELIADPGDPRYYPREAAIPLAQVRAAVDEFCRVRSGGRPECVPWLLLDQSV